MRKIKVLVVEDSMLFRELLVRKLNEDEGIEVVAAARDPFEARDMIIKHQPDVMTLDIELPRMDGIEFLRKLMPQYPLPVVMISSLSDRVFDAMNAGAVEFVAKPSSGNRKDIEEFITTELPVKIKIASVAKLRRNAKAEASAIQMYATPGRKCNLLAIGASTGGTEATAELLKDLHSDLPGIVIVQHMPAGFTELYANRLNDRCELEVREAKNGDVVRPGLALLAPGGEQQMQVVYRDGEYKILLKSAKSQWTLSVGGCVVSLCGKGGRKKCYGYYPHRNGRGWSERFVGNEKCRGENHRSGREYLCCVWNAQGSI